MKAMPGPHSWKDSVPLGFALRDMLGLASNRKEARKILNKGIVLVDGIARKEEKFPVGLFDFVEISEAKKAFRLSLDNHGRLVALEAQAEKKRALEKLCRIVGKKAFGKDAVRFCTNDGKSFSGKPAMARVFDTIVAELPKQKIASVLRLEEGSLAFIVGGTHVGELARVKAIAEGTMQKPRLVRLEAKGEEFQTTIENVFVVGKERPVIEVEAKKEARG
jgi:small subunit ribosomal protein S4e